MYKKSEKLFSKIDLLFYFLNFLVFLAAMFILNLRIQTTLIGYELGKLKAEEASLLKKKNELTMELATLTSKVSLIKKSNSPLNSQFGPIASK